ncbi:O-fucosyltransferase 29 [Camellia lanceoleosa]|uniref:O-fucosyltransferase 29 n=1 Tax=Camellia lanceoleosa TaxID=1840588 RepID=A0ACC0FJX4_9ERIC|nr:O-fucosyltransferase 29 [Camellia lanceoleosa]
MGVAKAWRLSGGMLSNLAVVNQQKKQHFWWRLRVSWSVVCGFMLFGLGLISLFTGHVASDLEWMGAVVHQLIFGNQNFQNFTMNAVKGGLILLLWYVSNFQMAIYLLQQVEAEPTKNRIVARILNATLVVPQLDHHSFWKDDSDFPNIFDVNWFISTLTKDVTIVKRVPDKVMRSMEKPPYSMRVPRKSEPEYYLDQVLPILLRRRVVQLTKFDYRLANNLDEELQKLRCRVNYHALRFTKPIRDLGQKLVSRMRKMTNRFIAIHLRFEPDMLAFSGCYYGGGDKERYELGEIRKRWTTLPDLSPDGERKRGKCPFTPHEVGLMLRALGFSNDTYLYVASGEIYGGEETLRPLRELFPNFYTKEMLASEELKPFLPFSSRLAAIDYIVCDESDVFVTNNNGNMAKILAGRRRYMGHKRTIRPNAKKLSSLFMARDKMDWDTFARKVKSCQRGFMGEPEEVRPGRDEFIEYPSSCICQKLFRYSNDSDGNQTSKEGAIVSETNFARRSYNGDDQGVKSLQKPNKTIIMRKGPVSLAGDNCQ